MMINFIFRVALVLIIIVCIRKIFHQHLIGNGNDNEDIALEFRSSSTENENHNISKKDWLIKMDKKYSDINEQIKRVCNKYSITQRNDDVTSRLFFWTIKNLAICTHSKVSSSTWWKHAVGLLPNEFKKKLKKKFGNKRNSKFMAYIDNYLMKDVKEIANLSKLNEYLEKNNYITFTFVRHPFERLVSAYNSKVVREKMIRIGQHEGRGYEKWYEKDHSFMSFINLVIDEYEQYCSPFVKSGLKLFQTLPQKYQDQIYGSMCEFDINGHWRPYASSCSYCEIKYDVIGRLESYEEDFRYVMEKSKLQSLDSDLRENSDPSKPKKDSMKDSIRESTKALFKNIPKEMIRKLVSMFQMDFEMFDYEISSYLT